MGGLRVFGRREIEWYPEGSQETLAVNPNEMTERYDVCGLSYEMSFPIIQRGITNKPRDKIDINSIKDILQNHKSQAKIIYTKIKDKIFCVYVNIYN